MLTHVLVLVLAFQPSSSGQHHCGEARKLQSILPTDMNTW